MNFEGLKHLIVGSGFWGSTLAERIANDLEENVMVIERRPHIGGNSYSEIDRESGVEVHKYGSHIFHTKDDTVWSYINRFTSFNSYQHKVLTTFKNKVYPMPISLATINQYYNLNLKPYEVAAFIEKESQSYAQSFSKISNLEEKAISMIGEPLYRAFIEGYTKKQWDQHPKTLPESIITRLPVRSNYNTNYFSDPYQGIPTNGYTSVFKKMLDNPRIDLHLNTDFFDLKNKIPSNCKIYYSGPIDRFFNYQFGELQWRTLTFESKVVPVNDFQGTSVMNYADLETPFTRIHEFKHYHPERDYNFNKSVLFYEYPKSWSGSLDPYYPVNTPENEKKFALYRGASEKLQNIVFGGRLGSYRYWDMEQAIKGALDLFAKMKASL
jgi:UDP-galactopyranose mutase